MQEKRKSLDILLWLAIVLLFLAGLWCSHYFSNADVSLHLLGWLILTIIIFAFAFFSSQGKAAWQFSKEARAELRKVVWPTRQETLQVTGMVILLVIILSLIIWGIDTIFLHLIGWLAGQRGS